MIPNKDLLCGILGTIALYQKAEAQQKCDELQEQARTAGAQQISEGEE